MVTGMRKTLLTVAITCILTLVVQWAFSGPRSSPKPDPSPAATGVKSNEDPRVLELIRQLRKFKADTAVGVDEQTYDSQLRDLSLAIEEVRDARLADARFAADTALFVVQASRALNLYIDAGKLLAAKANGLGDIWIWRPVDGSEQDEFWQVVDNGQMSLGDGSVNAVFELRELFKHDEVASLERGIEKLWERARLESDEAVASLQPVPQRKQP
jgi:hypothetical protein